MITDLLLGELLIVFLSDGTDVIKLLLKLFYIHVKASPFYLLFFLTLIMVS